MARPLPRRQAWSSAAEFNQVFDLLFSSNGDASSQRAAVDRLQAWQVRSPSSFAPSLAATASFVTLLLAPSSAAADAATGDASTQRRLALSMAITRFVNGLVDPLQQGYYARSIAQIAEELGLPSWFVDVRHRATHEDLPGEEVLRHAATQALDWLYARYWLPTLHSLSSSASSRSMQQAAHVDALASLLQQYKTLQKALLVDSTAAQPQDIDAILQEIVAWVVKAGFEAAAAGGVRLVSSDSRDGSADAEDEAESAGIAMLVERLAEVEVLVPRSRKKRTTVQAPAPLPRALTALYEPLLNHLASAYPTTFASTLIVHLLATVLSAPDALKRSQAPSTDRDDEATFFATLAGWFAWCLVDSKVLRLDVERKRQETKQLLLSPNPYATALLVHLQTSAPDLLPAVASSDVLLGLLGARNVPASLGNQTDTAQRLSVMQERWQGLLKSQAPSQATDATALDGGGGRAAQENGETPIADRTWPLYEEKRWQPCPIGMLPGGVLPDLAAVH